MKEVKAIVRENRLDAVLEEMAKHPELPGVTVSSVEGFGRRVGREERIEVNAPTHGVTKLVKLEAVVDDALVDELVTLITNAAQTGMHGDGKITISSVDEFVKVRTGERADHVV